MTLAAADLMKKAVVVDMTAPGSPLQNDMSDDWIASYEAAGCTFVSFTIATDHFADSMDYCTLEGTIIAIARARHWFLARPERFILVEKAADIARAKAEGKMAVGLSFQGTVPFQRNIKLVEVYKRLGVTHALMAYNNKNFVGDGCHERNDGGLSAFGLELIAEMNRVGMLVDVTHTGYRTAREAIAASTAPVIMSHSSPRAVFDHERNVPDDLIQAVAATGGVMGVHGVGIFMSADGLDVSARRIVDFIDHSVNLIGPEHVALGLDYVMNISVLKAAVKKQGDVYKPGSGYQNEQILFAPPSVIADIAEILLSKNYPEKDVLGILGANWTRVQGAVWG